MHEVVVAALGAAVEPEFSTACHGATGGNPFLLTELLSEVALAGISLLRQKSWNEAQRRFATAATRARQIDLQYPVFDSSAFGA